MSSSRRSATWPTSVVVGLLLLPSGCVAAGPNAGTSGGSGEAVPSAAVSTTVAPAAPGSVRPTAPGRAAATAPAVPQHRATLAPVTKERPGPARFRAPGIEVDLPVITTGVADDGRMQLPETNQEVAWYAFGSRPGDPTGTTVMAAHVDTRAEGLGPFARLRRLHPRDQLEVVDAAGRTHAYTVTAVDDVKKSDIALDQLFRLDGPPELKVLTCGGPYRRSTGYRDNIVVTAEPH